MSIRKITATLLGAALLCTGLTACGSGDTAVPVRQTAVSSDDGDWEVLTEGVTVLANDRLRWEMDVATTHFSVTDLTDGRVYHSVPQEELPAISAEIRSRLCSEVSVTYYDADSLKHGMFSATDSVEAGQMTVKRSGDAVRVYYTMGQSAEDMLVPAVFDRAEFEEILESDALSSGQTRRLKRNYSLYSADDPAEDYKEMVSRYPVLKTRDLYVLKDTADALAKQEIHELLTGAGYTREAYEAFLAEIGAEEEVSDSPGFVIPVEYTLCADGFSAAVLTDRIVEYSPSYKLAETDLLEFFASAGSESNGDFIVPDGVGARIRFNNQKSGFYSQTVYGTDPALTGIETVQCSQTATLPLFGMCFGQGGGILGIIESGAAAAKLNARVVSSGNPQNNAFVTFTLRVMDTTDIGTARNIPVYNLYSAHLLREPARVRYVLFDGETDYRRIAAYYRGYLTDAGMLKPLEDAPVPLQLDYLGMIRVDTTAFGIPYQRSVVLSTLSAIREDVEALAEGGIQRTELRLFGSEESGIEYTAHNRYRLNGRVGSGTGLEELASRLQKDGGRLWLDADFTAVYRDTASDGYDLKKNTARRLNRSLVRLDDRNYVTGKIDANARSRFAVSPVYYASMLKGFLQDVRGIGTDTGSIGLSVGNIGCWLAGDYRPALDADRCDALACLGEALAEVPDTAMTADGGNAYLFGRTSLLYNVPLDYSAFDIEEEEIPLYPMVVHGSIEYAGAPLNLSSDVDDAYLRTLEYGGDLYYRLMTGEDTLLDDTTLAASMYCLNSASRLEGILREYRTALPYLQAIRTAEMTDHRQVEEQVRRTVYGNGVSLLVNYGDTDRTVDGQTVPAHGFTVCGIPEGEE